VAQQPIISEVYYAEKDDWVEINNPFSSSSPIDLSEYRLRDTTKTNKIDLTGSLPPGGFAVFSFGNKLNNLGDTVKLVKKADDSEISSLSFGKGGLCTAPVGKSVFLVSGEQRTGDQTKGTENKDGTICVKQTEAPKITSTPEPTPILVTPTPKREVIKEVTSSPTPKAVVLSDVDQKNEDVSTSPIPIETEKGKEVLYSSTVSAAPVVYSPMGYLFIGIGVFCILLSLGLGILSLRRYNRKRHEKHILP
jgi:hypothetical protein